MGQLGHKTFGQSGTIGDHLGPVWVHLGPFGTIWDPIGTIWDHLGPFGTIWEPFGTIWDHLQCLTRIFFLPLLRASQVVHSAGWVFAGCVNSGYAKSVYCTIHFLGRIS